MPVTDNVKPPSICQLIHNQRGSDVVRKKSKGPPSRLGIEEQMTENEFTITDEEIELGFQLVLLANDRFGFSGQPSLIRAVVYVVGPMDLIVKTKRPNDEIMYSHRQFGDSGGPLKPSWRPVLTPVSSASDAIGFAREKIDERISRESGFGIDPIFPTMRLRCPSCNSKFTITKDFLAIDESVVCKTCGVENAATDMIA